MDIKKTLYNSLNDRTNHSQSTIIISRLILPNRILRSTSITFLTLFDRTFLNPPQNGHKFNRTHPGHFNKPFYLIVYFWIDNQLFYIIVELGDLWFVF